MSKLSTIKFFTTAAHPCSYLEDQQATTLFVDPDAAITKSIYSQLSEFGFRRSGSHFYRPHCDACQACLPTRVPVKHFNFKKKQSRIWKKNQDLSTSIVRPAYHQEHYDLYEKYITQRHSDGDMYPPSIEQYKAFLVHGWENEGLFIEFRLKQALIAVAVIDILDNGLSAVYTFFEPEQSKRSLGSYAILWQIEYCRKLQLSSVYLGYWVKQCAKMAYKSEYRPIEVYAQEQWVTLS